MPDDVGPIRIAIKLRQPPGNAPDEARLPPVVQSAISLLAGGRHTEGELNARVAAAGDSQALLRWLHALANLADGNRLAYALEAAGRPIATIEPLEPGAVWPPLPRESREPRRLSRFAYLRRDGDRIALESPLARARVILESEAVGLVVPWATGAFASVLDAWNLLEPEGAEPPAASMWEFHDALFHHASRLRAGRPSGATYRFEHQVAQWPAVKPRGPGRRIALPTPDMSALATREPPFAAIAEARRSVRSARSVLTLDELAAVLFRTLRVRSVEGGDRFETIRRPVPSGGALHVLELYVAVRQCKGLQPGVFWYDARAHELETVSADDGLAAALVDQASRSWGRQFPPPDVLLTLGARVPRVAWKYEGAAYRLVLLEVGVVMQMLYLIATAMGLAPCAVGNGDPSLFARITGSDPFEETSVGEFALSGRI
jgi:SagB-type dehydrogenase family enzyme